MKRILFLLLTMLMLVSMAGCVEVEEAEQKEPAITSQYGGHLDVGNQGRPTGLDPLKQVGTWKFQWTTPVYEPFLTRDSQNNIHPCVCDYALTSYEKDGQTYTDLKVWPREGYVFSHGYGQVEMEDLVASWHRGLNLYSKIKKYVAPNVVSAQVENDTELGRDVFHITFIYNERNLFYFAAWQTWWPVLPREICEKYADSYIADQLEDAVGTGPYVFSEFKKNTYVTLQKREDYVPVLQDESCTGTAATKYGYLDSMTFWYNGPDNFPASDALSRTYDCEHVIPTEYLGRTEEMGIVATRQPSAQRCWIIFKTNGESNLVTKYPSLRKAVMAAIDYPSFLEFVTDDSQVLENDNILLNELYDVTHKFKEADYYGPYDQAVVDKYLALAREEGYNGEPLLITSTGYTDLEMTAAAMEKAGINYEIIINDYPYPESIAADPSVPLDFYFDWEDTAWTPGTLSDALAVNNFRSDRVAQIREEMCRLDPTSPEYLALWEEWTDIWVEECQIGYLGAVEWYWWHPEELHINDGGDGPNDQCPVRFFYNTYWEDPKNHLKKS